MQIQKSMFLAGLTAVLLLASPMALRAANEPAPVGIRVIDVTNLYYSLQEKRDGDLDMDTMGKDLEKQREKKEDDLKAMTKELESYKVGSDEYKDLSEKLLIKGTELQAFGQYMQLKVQLEMRLRVAQLYQKINKAVEEYSKANGIGLVFSTDDPNLAKASSKEELVSRIAMRKVIYAYESLDITAQIREKMNSEYHAPAKP